MNELAKEIMELTNEAYKNKKECERKDNIIKELEKWLNENNLYKTNDNILAKLKELKNDNKTR